jgi:hypothetical protein
MHGTHAAPCSACHGHALLDASPPDQTRHHGVHGAHLTTGWRWSGELQLQTQLQLASRTPWPPSGERAGVPRGASFLPLLRWAGRTSSMLPSPRWMESEWERERGRERERT